MDLESRLLKDGAVVYRKLFTSSSNALDSNIRPKMVTKDATETGSTEVNPDMLELEVIQDVLIEVPALGDEKQTEHHTDLIKGVPPLEKPKHPPIYEGKKRTSRCAAPNCGKRLPLSELCQSPARPDRYFQWENFLGRNGRDPKQRFFLCKDHFDVRCFYSKEKKSRLVPGAYPSIHTEKGVENEILTTSSTENVKDTPEKQVVPSISEYFSLFGGNDLPSNIETINSIFEGGNQASADVESIFSEGTVLSQNSPKSSENTSSPQKGLPSDGANSQVTEEAPSEEVPSSPSPKKKRLEVLEIKSGVKTWKKGDNRYFLFPVELNKNHNSSEKSTAETPEFAVPVEEGSKEDESSTNNESDYSDPPALKWLQREFRTMKETIDRLSRQVTSWEEKYSKLKEEHDKLAHNKKEEVTKDINMILTNVFSPSQIATILNPSKARKIAWTKLELDVLTNLLVISPKAFKFMRDILKYPLPSTKALLRHKARNAHLYKGLYNEDYQIVNTNKGPRTVYRQIANVVEMEVDPSHLVEPTSPTEAEPSGQLVSLDCAIRDHEYTGTSIANRTEQ